jgi:periplasmic protein TonB
VFRRLLETYSRSATLRASAEGLALSLAAHLVLVGGAFVTGHRPARTVDSPDESMTAVEYLIPKDQMEGSRPTRERISWVSLDKYDGPGFDERREKKEDARLAMAVPKGDETSNEKGDAPPPPQAPIALGDSIKTELEVDSAVVRYEDSAAPVYPESLLRRRIEGMVLVQYVVDTTGHADTASFRVLSATHTDFVRSVKTTLPRMRFHPAVMGARRVPQLVEQPFVFKIVDTVRVAHESKRPPNDEP